jgi:hypothetical protein
MAWLLRKSAALVAVYSIALQALLWSFQPAGHFSFDPLSVTCAANSSGLDDPAPPQHGKDCEACLAACGGSPALIPAKAVFSPVLFADRPQRLALSVEALSLRPRHQPQESRAPPFLS